MAPLGPSALPPTEMSQVNKGRCTRYNIGMNWVASNGTSHMLVRQARTPKAAGLPGYKLKDDNNLAGLQSYACDCPGHRACAAKPALHSLLSQSM